MMRTKTGIVCVLAALTVGACSWGNGSSSNPSPDAAPVVCGDNVCASSEVNSCPQDCGTGGGNQNAVCGNNQCETSKGESATSCPSDCGGGGSNVQAVCGNSQCEAGETVTSCPSDCTGGGSGALDCNDPNTTFGCGLCTVAMICTPPYDAVSCAACGGAGLSLCTGGAPDGTCDAMEDNTTCPQDCP